MFQPVLKFSLSNVSMQLVWAAQQYGPLFRAQQPGHLDYLFHHCFPSHGLGAAQGVGCARSEQVG